MQYFSGKPKKKPTQQNQQARKPPKTHQTQKRPNHNFKHPSKPPQNTSNDLPIDNPIDDDIKFEPPSLIKGPNSPFSISEDLIAPSLYSATQTPLIPPPNPPITPQNHSNTDDISNPSTYSSVLKDSIPLQTLTTQQTKTYNPLDSPIKLPHLPLFNDKDPLYRSNLPTQEAFDTLHAFCYDVLPSVLGITPNPQVNSRHPYLNLYLYTSPLTWEKYLDKTIMVNGVEDVFKIELESKFGTGKGDEKSDETNNNDNSQNENSIQKNPKKKQFKYDPILAPALLSQVTLMTNVYDMDKSNPTPHNSIDDIIAFAKTNSKKSTSFAVPILLTDENYALYRSYHLKHFNHVVTGNYGVKHSRIFNPRYITTLLPPKNALSSTESTQHDSNSSKTINNDDNGPFEIPVAIQRRIDKNLLYVESEFECYISNPPPTDLDYVEQHHHPQHILQGLVRGVESGQNADGKIGEKIGEKIEKIEKIEKTEKISKNKDLSYDVKHHFKITVPLWFHQKYFLPVFIPDRLRVAQELTIGEYIDEFLPHKKKIEEKEEEMDEKNEERKAPRKRAKPLSVPPEEFYYDKDTNDWYPNDKDELLHAVDVVELKLLKFAKISTFFSTIPTVSPVSPVSPVSDTPTTSPTQISSNKFDTRQVAYEFITHEEFYQEFQSKANWEGLGVTVVENENVQSDQQSDQQNNQQNNQQNDQNTETSLDVSKFIGTEPDWLISYLTSLSPQIVKGVPKSPPKRPLPVKKVIKSHKTTTTMTPITSQDYHVFMSSLSKALCNVESTENFIPQNDLFSILINPPILTNSTLTADNIDQNGEIIEQNNVINSTYGNMRNVWRFLSETAKHETQNEQNENGQKDTHCNDDNNYNEHQISTFRDWFNYIIKRDDLSFIKTPKKIPHIDIERY